MGHLKANEETKEKPNDYADFRTAVSTSEFDFFRPKSGLRPFLAISSGIDDPGIRRIALSEW
jgi:hypothetical protein